jgi:O-methyltransferase
LKNCHEALPEEGKVIVCDYVVPDSAETSYRARTAFNFDLLVMLLLGSGGRTTQEFEILGKKAGFEVFRFICFASDIGVMEFLKTKNVN